MAQILLVHNERRPRKVLEQHLSKSHRVHSANNLAKAMQLIVGSKPDVVVAGADHRKPEALDLLRFMKRAGIKLPVLVVGPAATGSMQPAAMKLGAAAFLEYPVEESTLVRAISKAMQKTRDEAPENHIPPITEEEMSRSLADLEAHLNRQMECFAGKNQVYIQSLILGAGQKSKPRVALKCPLRRQFGHPPDVYYEYIRDVCCEDPSSCPAYREFSARNTA
jgi:DNA-binding NtrC family response regulator